MTQTTSVVDRRSAQPNRLRAKRIVLPVALLAAAVALLAVAAGSGGTLAAPVGLRVYEVGITLAAVGVIATGIWHSVRAGRLAPLLLMAVAAGTAFWQETYGDWGAYCLYSQRFLTHDWGHTSWTAPVQCWWFIPGYVVFYTTLFQSLILAVAFVRNRWPNRNPYLLAAVLSLPIFYAFDLVYEGTTVGLGLWSYVHVFGPAVSIGNGTFPLLWPILEQVPFMAIAAFGLTWRNDRGEDVFDVAARRVLRRDPGQVAVATSWILIVNATFLITTIVPLVLVRAVAGPANALIP